jgi:hypothetical protein
MSVKAFIKNEQKKRNKDTEVAPPPADVATEAVTVTEPPAAEGAANDSDVKPLDDGVNGELETDGVAAEDNTNAAPDSQVWQTQFPHSISANELLSDSSQRRKC